MTTEQERINELESALKEVVDVALFYQLGAADKGTLKFGYSRVIKAAKAPMNEDKIGTHSCSTVQ